MAVYDVYTENTLRLSFGKRLTKIPSLFKTLYVGASVDYLSVNYTSAPQLISNPFFGGSVYNSKANLGIDVGILAQIGNNLSIGLAGFNLNNPNIGIYEDNTINAVYRIGAAYKFIFDNEFIDGVNILADFINAYNEQKLGAGLEVLILKIINLRTGYNNGAFTLGIGCNYELEDMFCNINYSYSAASMDIPGLMNHRLSIGMKF